MGSSAYIEISFEFSSNISTAEASTMVILQKTTYLETFR